MYLDICEVQLYSKHWSNLAGSTFFWTSMRTKSSKHGWYSS